MNRTLEYFQDFLFLHPPVNQKSRNDYLLILQKEFVRLSKGTSNMWEFVHYLLEILKKPSGGKIIYASEVLHLITDVMQKDIEFWCKHYKHREGKENVPLVQYLFDVKNNSYNEERVETVLNNFIFCIKVLFTNCRGLKNSMKIPRTVRPKCSKKNPP